MTCMVPLRDERGGRETGYLFVEVARERIGERLWYTKAPPAAQ